MPRPVINANQPKVKHTNGMHTGGRPTQYLPVYAETAYMLALLGATNAEIAEALMIQPSTFYNWINKNPTFAQSVERGKMLADAKVAHSMYQRATGYNFESEELFYDRQTGEVVRAPTTKHCPPDVTAGFKWLGARRGAQWRERTATEITGANGQPLIPPVITITPVRLISKE